MRVKVHTEIWHTSNDFQNDNQYFKVIIVTLRCCHVMENGRWRFATFKINFTFVSSHCYSHKRIFVVVIAKSYDKQTNFRCFGVFLTDYLGDTFRFTNTTQKGCWLRYHGQKYVWWFFSFSSQRDHFFGINIYIAFYGQWPFVVLELVTWTESVMIVLSLRNAWGN